MQRKILYKEATKHKIILSPVPLIKKSIEEKLQLGYSIIDKPKGPTSHQIAAWIRDEFQSPVAHSGTLDPAVSGLLIILFGRARKVADLLAKMDKEYICEMQLHENVDKNELEKVIKMFIGEIYQKPPLRSAVSKKPRIRKIYNIEILDFKDRNVLLKIKCQAGTYIRKLCHDIGEILGCGAHMKDLRRTGIGTLNENDRRVVTLHELFGAYREWKNYNNPTYLNEFVRPLEELLFFLPKIYVKDSSLFSITHGSFVASPAVIAVTSDVKAKSIVTINTVYNEIIAIGKSELNSEEIVKSKSGIVAKVDKVLRIIENAGSGI
jgi:H/ACA ribonucleoprotein complex subunit 4